MKVTEEMLNRITNKGIVYARQYTLPLLVFNKDKKLKPQTATGIIIKRDTGFMLTTAGHVISGYLKLGENGRLQIGKGGNVLKNVNPSAVSVLEAVDFGVIKLDEEFVLKNNLPFLPITKLSKHKPKNLDLVIYIGYPGCWKTVHSEKVINLSPFECIATIETVEDDQFSMRIDESRYEIEGTFTKDIEDLGGISGAPIFSLFDFWNSKEREPVLIGWIHEGLAWNNLTQKHYAVHSSLIDRLKL